MATEDPGRTDRIRARDPDVLQQVAAENLPVLMRGALAAGLDRDLAEDVVQATFLTFIEKADQFDGRARVRTYLFGIMYKKVSEARRRIVRDRELRSIDVVMEQRFDAAGSWSRPPQPTDLGLTREEVRRWVRECMESLPERHRMAFALREVEGMKSDEICKILGVTVNNLGVILYRGRNSLRECLEAKGLKGSGDAAL